MDSPEIVQLKKRIKYSSIIIVVLILVSLGFFFYGMINNFRMKQERQLAIELQIRSEKLARENMELRAELQRNEQLISIARDQAIMARDRLLLNAEKAESARQNASKK